jgi:hypothetical protein
MPETTPLATANNEPSLADATSKVQEIVVANPTTEELQALLTDIKVNYNFDVDVKSTQFNFKKSKDKDTGIETIRHPVVLALPYPSVEGIVTILQTGGKGLELLQEAIETVVNAAARDILYDSFDLTAATFPVDKVSWETIANLPKAQRKGGGIPKETWEAFGEDYVAIMPEATGKRVDQVTNMAKLLLNKLNSVKTNEAVLQLAVEQLGIYTEKSENAGEYADCIEFLLNKAETFLNVSEEELLANL